MDINELTYQIRGDRSGLLSCDFIAALDDRILLLMTKIV